MGRLTACESSDSGGRAVVRYDMTTGERTVIADKYMGKKFNARNDLIFDSKGELSSQ